MLLLAVTEVLAQPGVSQDANFLSFLPLILLFIVFYFLLIRPQSKRIKEHKSMIDSLKKGDEVVTNGGLLGRVVAIGENFVEIEPALNTQIRVQKQAVATLMPKGTMKGDL